MAAAVPACSEMDHFRGLQEAQKDRLDGAVAKHPACDGFLFKGKQEREALIRSAAQTAATLLEQARKVRKEEGVRLLEQALSNFKGLPEEGRLTALLAELRRS